MARTKLSANLPGVHSMPRAVGKGGIPLNTKSAFLELFMYENEKNRLLRERDRSGNRRKAINKKLGQINKAMAQLIKSTVKGSKLKLDNPGSSKEKKRLVLNY